MKISINILNRSLSVYSKTKNSLYTPMQDKIKKFILNILAIILAFISILGFIYFIYVALRNLGLIPQEEGILIIGVGDVLVSAIAAIAVVYQLGQVRDNEQKVREIEEGRFILQFNQSFVQDVNICKIEELLEQQMLNEVTGPILNLSNRQSVVNYLVYLEGLAALVNRNVLTIENIDDLFAYRFFLAMNNEEIQNTQLLTYPDYYRGCFKLYALWKSYRKEKNLPIIQSETSLDKWIEFEKYVNCCITIRKCEDKDSSKRIAKIIYDVDPYIYPTAFGSKTKAKKVLSKLIKEKHGIFSRENIRLAIYRNKIVGVGVILSTNGLKKIDKSFIATYSKILPNFADVCTRYFDVISENNYETSPYLLCLGVHSSYNGKGIGSLLLKNLLSEYKDKPMSLHVLKKYDNKGEFKKSSAIKLYEKYGFKSQNETKGYALIAACAPDCIEMVRANGE